MSKVANFSKNTRTLVNFFKKKKKLFNGIGKPRQPGCEETGNHRKGSSLKRVQQLCASHLEPIGNTGIVLGKQPSHSGKAANLQSS